MQQQRTSPGTMTRAVRPLVLAIGTATALAGLTVTGASLPRGGLIGTLQAVAASPTQILEESKTLAFTPVPIPLPRHSLVIPLPVAFTPVPIPLTRLR